MSMVVKVGKDCLKVCNGNEVLATIDGSTGIGVFLMQDFKKWTPNQVMAFLLGWYNYSLGGKVDLTPEGVAMFIPLEMQVTAADTVGRVDRGWKVEEGA